MNFLEFYSLLSFGGRNENHWTQMKCPSSYFHSKFDASTSKISQKRHKHTRKTNWKVAKDRAKLGTAYWLAVNDIFLLHSYMNVGMHMQMHSCPSKANHARFNSRFTTIFNSIWWQIQIGVHQEHFCFES